MGAWCKRGKPSPEQKRLATLGGEKYGDPCGSHRDRVGAVAAGGRAGGGVARGGHPGFRGAGAPRGASQPTCGRGRCCFLSRGSTTTSSRRELRCVAGKGGAVAMAALAVLPSAVASVSPSGRGWGRGWDWDWDWSPNWARSLGPRASERERERDRYFSRFGARGCLNLLYGGGCLPSVDRSLQKCRGSLCFRALVVDRRRLCGRGGEISVWGLESANERGPVCVAHVLQSRCVKCQASSTSTREPSNVSQISSVPEGTPTMNAVTGAVNALFSFKPFFKFASGQARKMIIERGTEIGYPWAPELARLREYDWDAHLKAVQNPDIEYPEVGPPPQYIYSIKSACNP